MEHSALLITLKRYAQRGISKRLLIPRYELNQKQTAPSDNGWRTFEHHDNWIKNEHYPNPTFEQQFDTGNAYNEMLKTKN